MPLYSKAKRRSLLPNIIDMDDKSLLNLISQCANCNSCRDQCPIFAETHRESDFMGGRMRLLLSYLKEGIPCDQKLYENLFRCSTCAQCEEICPLDIKTIDFIEFIRKKMNQNLNYNTLNHSKLTEHIYTTRNPYNEPDIKRGDWKNAILSKISHSLKESSDIGYFVGCTSAYRDQESARNTALILSHLLPQGFCLLDSEEYCCGSPLIRTGMEFKDEYVKINIANLQSKGVKTIVTSCAGCYKTISKDWPTSFHAPLPFKILHISQFLAKNIEKLKSIMKPLNKVVTYHDPCHIGRAMGIYEEPRTILQSIPEIKYVEMKNHGKNSLCCGAGGGFRMNFKSEAEHMATRRLQDAIDEHADILATSCVFCKYNFQSGMLLNKESSLSIMNLEDIIVELLGL